MENFVDWIANGSPPWAACCAFISGRLVALEKQYGVRPVGVGQIVIKVIRPEATMTCQDEQLYAVLRAVIDGMFHGIQYIQDKNSTMEDWGFLLVDAKNSFNEIS